MKNKNTYQKILTLISGLLLFICSGCISDSMDDCDTEENVKIISFSFLYDYHLYFEDGDRFEKEVDHIDLFIYDEEENLFTTYQVSRTEMSPNHTIELELPEGGYTAVAWANCNNDNFVYSHQDKLQTFQLSLACVEDGDVKNKNLGSIFHSMNTFSVNDWDEMVTMSMIKNSNLIRIRMHGLTPEDRRQAEEIFYTRVESYNSVYKYDNSLSASDKVYYLPTFHEEGEDEVVEFYVLRIHAQDMETKVTLRPREDVAFRIYGFESTIVPKIQNDIFLRQQLRTGMSIPDEMSFDEYIERCDEFELEYNMIYTKDEEGNIVISINPDPWDSIQQPGGLK